MLRKEKADTMRHRKAGLKLNRTSSHRKAMFRNMVTSLFKHERIRTTDVKAKELRRWADNLITLAKRGDLHARRQALAIVREKAVVHKLFEEAAQRYGSVSGGYTRIVKLGRRRGDAAPISMIELVTPEPPKKKKKKAKAPVAKKPVAKKPVAKKKEVAEEKVKEEEKVAAAGVAEEEAKVTEEAAEEMPEKAAEEQEQVEEKAADTESEEVIIADEEEDSEKQAAAPDAFEETAAKEPEAEKPEVQKDDSEPKE